MVFNIHNYWCNLKILILKVNEFMKIVISNINKQAIKNKITIKLRKKAFILKL